MCDSGGGGIEVFGEKKKKNKRVEVALDYECEWYRE